MGGSIRPENLTRVRLVFRLRRVQYWAYALSKCALMRAPPCRAYFATNTCSLFQCIFAHESIGLSYRPTGPVPPTAQNKTDTVPLGTLRRVPKGPASSTASTWHEIAHSAGHVTLDRKQTNPDPAEPAPRSCFDSTRVTTPYRFASHHRKVLTSGGGHPSKGGAAVLVHASSSLCLRNLPVPPLPPSTSIASSAYFLHWHSSTKPRTITRRIYTPLLHPIAPPH